MWQRFQLSIKPLSGGTWIKTAAAESMGKGPEAEVQTKLELGLKRKG